MSLYEVLDLKNLKNSSCYCGAGLSAVPSTVLQLWCFKLFIFWLKFALNGKTASKNTDTFTINSSCMNVISGQQTPSRDIIHMSLLLTLDLLAVTTLYIHSLLGPWLHGIVRVFWNFLILKRDIHLGFRKTMQTIQIFFYALNSLESTL